ncbi:FRG domain-containing protein [Shouchella clausii]|uniref:FRG domain-containing protein n=1 Tax=Shouchella clausii TaxID=79880 RepID=UPI002708CEC0|nr:FRG domain-containing protein [Shouchella clausii]MDO7267094.1 FRG domain-containing protein [Shouchella clausii]MDO7285991.1 FRG domain-containing protein [Shouchella clausii]
MVTSKVLKEVWLEDNDMFFKDFSPVGKYSFLFERFIFRGERTEKFNKLLPTSLREDKGSVEKLYGFAQLSSMDISHPQYNFESFYQLAELNILMNFYRAANHKGLNLPDIPFFRNHSLEEFLSIDILRDEIGEKWLPDNFLELAALAQHYGLPTRLIDWSKDIYTSLYFASSGALHSDDDSKYMILYALDYFTIEFLKKSTHKISLRLVVPEHYKNPNLNFQKGILSAWEYKTCYIQDLMYQNSVLGRELEDLLMPLVNYKSLDTLIQEYVDENNISWGGVGVKERKPLIYKFYIPMEMSHRIYDYLLKIGYGADRLFTGFEGISQMLKDNMAYYKKVDKINLT